MLFHSLSVHHVNRGMSGLERLLTSPVAFCPATANRSPSSNHPNEDSTMASLRELLESTKSQIREVTTAEADELRRAPGAVTLDVREPDEYEQGALPRAVHIARGTLETSIEMKVPDKTTPLVVYCAGGTRSAFAAKTLHELGYSDVVSVIGGFNRWKDEDREWGSSGDLLFGGLCLLDSHLSGYLHLRFDPEVLELEFHLPRKRLQRLRAVALAGRLGLIEQRQRRQRAGRDAVE